MKYWIIFKNSLQSSLAYRFNFFASILYEGLALLIFGYVWFSIYNQGGVMGDYTLRGILFYYIVTAFIRLIIFSGDIARTVGDEIRNGRMSIYLIAPINYFNMQLVKSLGIIFTRLIIFLPLFVVVLFFFNNENTNWLSVLIFFPALVLGFMINFIFGYLIGISTFYFGFVQGLNFTVQNVANFFSGVVVPLSLLPVFCDNIADLLPFKYIIYLPNQIISGQIELVAAMGELLTGFVWLIILFTLSLLVYSRGLKRFEGEGL